MKKVKLLVIVILNLLFLSIAYSWAAEVRNTVATQVGNHTTFIYDLIGEEADAEVNVTITIQGKTYHASDLHLEGDIGKVKSGRGKTIYWNVLQDFPRGFSGEIVWKIVAGGEKVLYGKSTIYQVTGPVLKVNADTIVIHKGKDKWEFARDSITKVIGNLKIGSKVTIEYTMKAVTLMLRLPGKGNQRIYYEGGNTNVEFAIKQRTYQVTGPVLEVNADTIVIQKGVDKWKFARDAATKVTSDLKVGSRVSIEYTMKAVTIRGY